MVDIGNEDTTAHVNEQQSDITDMMLPHRRLQRTKRAPGSWWNSYKTTESESTVHALLTSNVPLSFCEAVQVEDAKFLSSSN